MDWGEAAGGVGDTIKPQRESICRHTPVLTRSVLFDYVTPWTAACQTPLSMGFSKQEYWSGLPYPFPGDLSNLGIASRSPALQVDSLPAEPLGKPNLLVILFFKKRFL